MENGNGTAKKIRILALCDSPTSATGFAQVSRNILQGLAKTGKYHIDVIGINYYGDYYDRAVHPYNIYPAMRQGDQDMYGRGRVLNAINAKETNIGLTPPFDIVFTIQDSFIIEGLGLADAFPWGDQMRVTAEMWRRSLEPDMWFKWVGYFPVDSDLKENWVTRAIALPHYPVAYCEWGRQQMLKYDRKQFELKFNIQIKQDDSKKKARVYLSSLKERAEVIHHGVDVKTFKPLSKEEIEAFKKDYFRGKAKGKYLVVNISRNQPRKDLPRTMAAFKLFKKTVPNALLYLHCHVDDVGGSIHEIARGYGLVFGEDYLVPENFNANIGFPVETINKIYNAADVCITTTLGEGWGFITTEAMAAKVPIVAPNITSILDIFNSYDFDYSEEALSKSETLRGIPVKAGSNSSEWFCMGQDDNERIRPLTNVDDMVAKMIWAYNHPGKVEKIVERAYRWVQGLSWDHIVKDWDNLMMKAYNELEKDRSLGRAIDKAGRNDSCPCGSGQKFKKCHGSVSEGDRFKDWFYAE